MRVVLLGERNSFLGKLLFGGPYKDADARDDHRRRMNQGRYGGRTLHGVRQPDMEREHGALARSADEHKSEGQRDHCPGGGQQLCPEALINDGLLHLRIFTGEELIPALFSTLANPENSPNIVDGVSSWFEITAPHEMTFNLDGEPLSGKTFRMELLPAALRCRLPPDCPLLR